MADRYGNQVRLTDEFGNPIPQGQGTGYGGATAGGHGSGYGAGAGERYGTGAPHEGVMGGGGGHVQQVRPQTHQEDRDRGLSGMLHRSGSSSSSSEDDGYGGRRKKGMKEKIKEKIPGGHKTEEHGYPAGAAGYGGTTGGYGGPGPTGHGGTTGATGHGGTTEGYGGTGAGHGATTGATGYGGTTTTTGGVHGYEQQEKGMMEKIKEKLPGGQKTEEYGHTSGGYGGHHCHRYRSRPVREEGDDGEDQGEAAGQPLSARRPAAIY